MPRTARHLVLLLAVLLCSAPIGYVQVVTGAPPFGSFGGGPDTINLGNLNINFAIPVLNKPGRGINFAYNLSYDSSVWYPVLSAGTTTWQPTTNWGWRGQTEASTGYVQFASTGVTCFSGRIPIGVSFTLANWVYHDSWGVPHSFVGTAHRACNGTGTDFTATATDGSGYTLTGKKLLD
jgi:hypothetical protein